MTEQRIIADMLMMHDPLRNKNNSERGESIHNPLTEFVAIAVLHSDEGDDGMLADNAINNFIRQRNIDAIEHTKDFLMSDTAPGDTHSIVRIRHNKHYRVAWDIAEFFRIDDKKVIYIDRNEFFNEVKRRLVLH